MVVFVQDGYEYRAVTPTDRMTEVNEGEGIVMEIALNRVREFHRRIGAPVADGAELLACQRTVQSAKWKVPVVEW